MNSVNRGRSLQLYFIDGRPDGMLTAEVFNWTGHILRTPKTQINDALNREEASRTGVYILIGELEGRPLAYIGETGNISNRIRHHLAQKEMEWWDTATLVTCANNRLNKDHVRYLEARLIEKASAIDPDLLYNRTNPDPLGFGLPEVDRNSMEEFLDYLLMILPALRIDMFLDNRRPPRPVAQPPQQEDSAVFELATLGHGLKATAVLESGEFVVQEGSQARAIWGGDPNHPSYSQLHAALVRQQVLRRKDGHLIFTTNYAFRSPSAAASVILGRSAGPREWKVQGTNQTYGEWYAAKFGSSTDMEATKKGDNVSLEERVKELEEQVEQLKQAIQNGIEARDRVFEELDKRVKENKEAIDRLQR